MALSTYVDVGFAVYLALLLTHVQALLSSPPSTIPLSLFTVLVPLPLWIFRVLSPTAKSSWRLDLFLTLVCADQAISPLDWHSRVRSQLDPTVSTLRTLSSYWAIWFGAIWVLTLEYKRSVAGSPMGDGDAVPQQQQDQAQTQQQQQQQQVKEQDDLADDPTAAQNHIPPMLIPARTTHTRLVPKRHSFAYGYLLVGIPVGWTGRAGLALSADADTRLPNERKRGWFDVRARDYLARGAGNEVKGLEAKLRDYLRSNGVGDKEWGWAYLVTAPRFLGYAFNPVSFWYVYERDGKDGQRGGLRCMVLEVNNTFGERRMYLLKPDTDEDKVEEPGKRFTDRWEKDFHVSPFNSTKGTYSLSAKDLLAFKDGAAGTEDDVLNMMVDNNITLTTSKGETKLVARVFSEGDAIDPARLTSLGLGIVLLTWCWVGFATFPRIIYEAGRLFFQRKLHVWFRPEVLPSSLGREATVDEKTLEVSFRKYLRSIVVNSDTSVKIVYTPPGDVGEPYIWTSNTARDSRRGKTEIIEVKVLSPYFYSRFVHYVHATEAFAHEGQCAEVRNRTVTVSRPELLDLLIRARNKNATGAVTSATGLDALRWDFLRRLRCPPPAVAYPDEIKASDNPQMKVTDIRPQRLSDIDRFVLSEEARPQAIRKYRRMATRMFLAQRIAFGITQVVDLLDWITRAGLVAGAFAFVHKVGPVGLEALRNASVDAWSAGAVAGAAGCLVHMWDLLKG